MISRIYTYSVKTSVAAIYIDMTALNRLTEFYDLLEIFKELKDQLAVIFQPHVQESLLSSRIVELTSMRKIGEGGAGEGEEEDDESQIREKSAKKGGKKK